MSDVERDALELAVEYAVVDPFYLGKPPDPRERKLMALAIRAYRSPDLTRRVIARYREAQQTTEPSTG